VVFGGLEEEASHGYALTRREVVCSMVGHQSDEILALGVVVVC
jgi:hypothetical protein